MIDGSIVTWFRVGALRGVEGCLLYSRYGSLALTPFAHCVTHLLLFHLGNPYEYEMKCYTDKCIKNTLSYFNAHPNPDALKSNKQVRSLLARVYTVCDLGSLRSCVLCL